MIASRYFRDGCDSDHVVIANARYDANKLTVIRLKRQIYLHADDNADMNTAWKCTDPNEVTVSLVNGLNRYRVAHTFGIFFQILVYFLRANQSDVASHLVHSNVNCHTHTKLNCCNSTREANNTQQPSQMNPVHILPSGFFKINLSITVPL
jgi:hypothetical protein